MTPLDSAIEYFKRLSQCLVTFCISQESLLRRRIKDQDVGISGSWSEELWKQITCDSNDHVPLALERIICAVLASEVYESTVRYDLADLMATVDGCGGVFFGYGSSSRAGGPIRAVDRASKHALLSSEPIGDISGTVVVIESKARGEKMQLVREAMNLVKDVIGDRCSGIFSWNFDPDLPADYRVTLMVAHADSKNANYREVVVNSFAVFDAEPQLPINVSTMELDAAATLIQKVYQPGGANNGPVSFLRRHMRIGFHKVSAIVEGLESNGVIASTPGGSDLFSHGRVK